jgi:hypothetical protein
VLQIRFARNSGETFLGDKTVIRSSIHIARTFTGSPAGKNMLRGTACNALRCPGLEWGGYQPDQNGQDRFELDI